MSLAANELKGRAAPVLASRGGGRLRRAVGDLWPGLGLAIGVAAAAYALRGIPGVSALSPMALAILVGLFVRNAFGVAAPAAPGVAFALRRVLRFAIILLGFQLTLSQAAEIGAAGVAVIALTLIATFLFTTWIGRLMGVDAKLTQLIAAGTSICGASAVIATNTVTRGSDEDVAYAIACVTLFGSVAMVLYPLLPGALGLDAQAYGLWTGASIHEIAQVVAASFAQSHEAGEFGTVAKLSRIILLAPVVVSLGLMARGRSGGEGGKAPMPWFVLGFVAIILFNSAVDIGPDARAAVAGLTAFLLSVALAAMGLSADVRKLTAKGVRPLLLGLASFLFIASFSLILVKLTG
jgi:uncharacterized integral membrane protein (TIGR00698 family)